MSTGTDTLEALPVRSWEFTENYRQFESCDNPRLPGASKCYANLRPTVGVGLISFSTTVEEFDNADEAKAALDTWAADIVALTSSESPLSSVPTAPILTPFDVTVGERSFGGLASFDGPPEFIPASAAVTFARGDIKGTVYVFGYGSQELTAEAARLAGLLDARIVAVGQGLTVSMSPPDASVSNTRIRLDAIDCVRELPLGRILVKGSLSNIGGAELGVLVATVLLYDRERNEIRTAPVPGSDPTDEIGQVPPGGSATFDMALTNQDPNLVSCAIAFEDCATICIPVPADGTGAREINPAR